MRAATLATLFFYGLSRLAAAVSAEAPSDAQTLITAQAAANAGDFSRAEDLYKQAVALHPAADTYQRLGLVCHLQNKFPEAAKAFTDALKLDPKLWTSRLFLGMDEYRMNRFRDALTELQAAERLHPGYTETLFWMGATHLALHEYWNGFQELEEVLKKEPEHADALRLLAESYATRGTELLNRVAEQHPDSAAGLQVQGRAYEFEGANQTALQFYRASAAKDPHRAGIQEAITRLEALSPR